MQPAERSTSRLDSTWSPTAETMYSPFLGDSRAGPTDRILRFRVHDSAAGSHARTRIADDVAERAAGRIGTLAILTAITVLAASILEHALQSEMAAAEQSI